MGAVLRVAVHAIGARWRGWALLALLVAVGGGAVLAGQHPGRPRPPGTRLAVTGSPGTGGDREGAERRPATESNHQTLTAAVAQASGGPGRNPGESGLTADKRVVPPPAARA